MTKKTNKIQIKTIIFDLGGVLVFYNHMLAAKPMARLVGLSSDKVFKIISSPDPNSRFANICEKGAHSEVYWNFAAKKLGIKNFPYKKFNFLWNSIFWPNKELLNFLPRLKKKYKIGLISNLGKEHKKYLLKKYDLNKLVNVSIYSCNVKIRKPSSKIYQTALNKLGARPEETIFIDDIEKNLIKAKKLGMHTILFKTNKQLFKQLKQLGVRLNDFN